MIDAKEYLEWIKRQDKMIQNKLVEIAQLRSLAENTGSLSTDTPVQTSHGGDRIGIITANIVDKTNEYNDMVKEFVLKKEERIKTIEQIDDVLQYTILHKHYVQYKPLTEIMNEERYSYSWILKQHNEGLKKVEKILKSIA